MPQTKTRILIVEDHAVVREGLKFILAAAEDLEVCASAASRAEAFAALDAQPIDLVLLDIGLGAENGLELLRTIRRRLPAPHALIVSAYPESEHAMQALADGAAGFVSKNSPPAVLLAAIRRAASGERYIGTDTATHIALGLRGKSTGETDALSERERQILHRLALGQSQTAIGAQLGLSVKTVNTYRARILKKTHCATTAELIRYAVRKNLIER